MRRLTTLLSLIVLFVLPSSAQDWPDSFDAFMAVDAASVVIENVTVIDGTGNAPVEGQTVLIQDGVIQGVGSDISIPVGVHTIDGTGKTLIPGLIGLHNHTFYTTSQRRIQLDVTAPLLYLASGVTTIRTTGSYAPYSELELKRAVNNRERIGPRMFVTGPYITGGEGY
ncbi:MAG: amidohydrolase, partial [Bacteroidetes bacterium]|nr:amidohydrolase [Bacteroidota bacterium]